jgi:protein-S-isoprenylcysteine O-methyltransferase
MEQVWRFGLFFLFIGLEFLRKGSEARTIEAGGSDRHSTILIGIAFTVALVVSPLLNILGVGYVPISFFYWGGIILAAVGIFIRFLAMKSLGEFYTRTLVITKEHTVVDWGPYAWVRHPGYFGSTLFWLGITLSSYNLLATGIVLVLIIAAYLYRIRAEEAMLLEAFGKGYRSYMKKTKRLIPFVY